MITAQNLESELRGMIDWEWGKRTSFDGMVNYVYKNYSDDELYDMLKDERLMDRGIASYLRANREDPSDYGLRESKTSINESYRLNKMDDLVDEVFYGDYKEGWFAIWKQESIDELKDSLIYIGRMRGSDIDYSNLRDKVDSVDNLEDMFSGDYEDLYVNYVKQMSDSEFKSAEKYIRRMYSESVNNNGELKMGKLERYVSEFGEKRLIEAKKREKVSNTLEAYLADNGFKVDKKVIPALADMLEFNNDVGMSDINKIRGRGTSISVEFGNQEWEFMTEKEAEERAIDYTKDLIDDIGFDGIRGWENYIDEKKAESFFRGVYEEWDYSYAEDIERESSMDDEYANRLEEEMAEWKAKDIDDFVSKMVDDKISEGQGGYDHYESNFGREEAQRILQKENLIDVDGLVQYIVDTDGLGNTLFSYDGEGYHFEDIFYYRLE